MQKVQKEVVRSIQEIGIAKKARTRNGEETRSEMKEVKRIGFKPLLREGS